jgi:osmotically inducible lipoprotein OsmB
MSQLNSFSAYFPIALLASALGLGGCAGMTAQEKGTATGAAIGGVLGAASHAAGSAVASFLGLAHRNDPLR